MTHTLNDLAICEEPRGLYSRDQRSSSVRPTKVQSAMLHSIRERVALFGDPDPEMTTTSALAELGVVKDLYTQEPRHLTSYDPSKLKVAKGAILPEPVAGRLSPSAALLHQHRDVVIEKSEQEIAALGPEDRPRAPYWDPVLKRSASKRHGLFRTLFTLKMLGFRTGIKAMASFFFVDKSNGMIRLICDARIANACHHRPPVTRLSSPASVAGLDLSDAALAADHVGDGLSEVLTIDPHANEADVVDCFHNFLNEEMGSWFGLDEWRTVAEWRRLGFPLDSIFDDTLGRRRLVAPMEVVCPCLDSMGMGWSWALFFANDSVSWQVACASGLAPGRALRDKHPVPSLRPGLPVSGTYVDNILLLGATRPDVSRVSASVATAFKRVRIPLQWSHEQPEREVTSVGLKLNMRGLPPRVAGGPPRRIVMNKPVRVWRTILAGAELCRRRRVRGEALRVWLGHVVNLLQLTTPAMSTLSCCYAFVEKSLGRRTRLWLSVRVEIRRASSLLLLTVVDLSAPLCTEVGVSDSSDLGFCVMTAQRPAREIREVMRFRERWRFRDLAVRSDKRAVDGDGLDFAGGLSCPAGPRPDAPPAPVQGPPRPGAPVERLSIRTLRSGW